MRLLCDEMLAGLGRWLRAAGYDTAIAERGSGDAALLEAAIAEDRILLTCDGELAGRRGAFGRVVVLPHNGLDGQARELQRRLGLDWLHDPFTRCVVDNTGLRDPSEEDRAAVPAEVRALGGPHAACPACGRIYWMGNHHRRMQARLERWQRGEGQ